MAKRRLFQWDDVGFHRCHVDSQSRDEESTPSTGGTPHAGDGGKSMTYVMGGIVRGNQILHGDQEERSHAGDGGGEHDIYVMGLDLGNCYSYASTVVDMDERRSGGTELTLMDPDIDKQVGVPSRFFYDGGVSGDPLVCRELDRYDIDETAGVGMLKRHINESFEMGGRTFAYRDAVTRVAQHVVRMANESLLEQRQATTRLVSLAYPATFSSADRRALVGAVEGATLEDGRHVEVVGTIMEPAAAALEYLARRDPGGGARTVLVYDLGGGTFDATALTAYPEGEEGAGGARYFYREHLTEGIPDLGGEDFSAALRGIIERAVRESDVPSLNDQGHRNRVASGELLEVTRRVKHSLSRWEDYQPTMASLGVRTRPVTRAEFEEATRGLLRRTVEVVTGMLDRRYGWPRPETIVLTGEASKMPMVRRALGEALEPYGYGDGDIVSFRPSDAISFGASRFGVVESVSDIHLSDESGKTEIRQAVSPVLAQRTRRSIGIRYYDDYDADPDKLYIKTLIPEGATLPFTECEFDPSNTPKKGLSSISLQVFEALVEKPDPLKWDDDNIWRKLGELTLDLGAGRPKGYKCYARLVIDRDGTLRVEAYDERGRDKSFVHKDIDWELEEVSTDSDPLENRGTRLSYQLPKDSFLRNLNVDPDSWLLPLDD